MKNIVIAARTYVTIALSRYYTHLFVQTIAYSWLIALGTHIKVPFFPVPMTLQTFSIALISLLAPIQVAIGSVAAYIGYAVLGIPVLTAGGGIAALTGPTAGYIAGFLCMSSIISLLMKYYPTSNIWKRVLFISLGGVVLFLLGITHLAHLFGWEIAIKTGLLPFMFAEPVKYTLAAYLSICIQDKYLKH